MRPLGWGPPYLVDNIDPQYLGDQYWRRCWYFTFSFFFESICLSMCHSVCVSVHLFSINPKFLKTLNYWLAHLLYVGLVPGLELKTSRMHMKILSNFFKKSWQRHYYQGLGQNNLFSNVNSHFCYNYYLVLAGSNNSFRVRPNTSSG